ncbi:hypothetical protein [[Clostridium] polysaccharolyticum]|uniref:hypothetical protein n=1 Tax=[Clostridium] polysaccharolyticum TaxID=29364 RepID=UPI000B84F502|nr:hypothetical protein [[Clostridium] polysaccharolyticum]
MLGFGQGDKVTIWLTDFARKENWEDGTYQSNDISALQWFASEGEILSSEGDKKEGLHSICMRK